MIEAKMTNREALDYLIRALRLMGEPTRDYHLGDAAIMLSESTRGLKCKPGEEAQLAAKIRGKALQALDANRTFVRNLRDLRVRRRLSSWCD